MNPYRDQHISSSISYNDYGIDKYMKMVDDELIKNGHRLSDSLFISQLSALVDTLSSNNFNKTLFNHISDFSNLDITKPIKLNTPIANSTPIDAERMFLRNDFIVSYKIELFCKVNVYH